MKNFVKQFETSIRENWNAPAVSDYKKEGHTYSDVAREIIVLQNLWKNAGLVPNDKIALNAKSSKNWIEVFMAAVCGKYVSVQLFPGFTPADTSALVNHSDSRILYTDKAIFSAMDFESMPQLLAAIDTNTLELLASRGNFAELYENRYKAFEESYPQGLKPEDVVFDGVEMEDICAIMYTSGSTGNPKGVMLKVRNFSANADYVPSQLPFKKGTNYLSVLPYAHIFGLTVDGIIPLLNGMHLHVFGMMPVPSALTEAFKALKPKCFFAVPMILSHFVNYSLASELSSSQSKAKLADFQNNPEFCAHLRQVVMDAMGGEMELFATGGAAIPSAIEDLLAFKLNLPFITGYGMTECAPVISLGVPGKYKAKSVGNLNLRDDYIQVKISSQDPLYIPGEVLLKGDPVFCGYYKNDAATAEAFTDDGWFRTGDIGTIDEDQTLFLSGRSKSMILSDNGQNIFPEEIEVVLNGLPYVSESLVVLRRNALCALIVPNQDALANDNINAESLQGIMTGNIKKLNTMIPTYATVSDFELKFEPFAKTPKGSIKRFMYV